MQDPQHVFAVRGGIGITEPECGGEASGSAEDLDESSAGLKRTGATAGLATSTLAASNAESSAFDGRQPVRTMAGSSAAASGPKLVVRHGHQLPVRLARGRPSFERRPAP